jgi:anti-anti-sigma factor
MGFILCCSLQFAQRIGVASFSKCESPRVSGAARADFGAPRHGTSLALVALQEFVMKVQRIDTDMDAERVSALRAEFETLAEAGEDVALDLGRVRFIDSSGIGAIVFLFKRLSARERKLSIMNVQGQPLRLFVQLRLTFLLSSDEASNAA